MSNGKIHSNVELVLGRTSHKVDSESWKGSLFGSEAEKALGHYFMPFFSNFP